MASDLTTEKLDDLLSLKARASESLIEDGITEDRLEVTYQADLRYAGQAFQITVELEAELREKGVAVLTLRLTQNMSSCSPSNLVTGTKSND